MLNKQQKRLLLQRKTKNLQVVRVEEIHLTKATAVVEQSELNQGPSYCSAILRLKCSSVVNNLY